MIEKKISILLAFANDETINNETGEMPEYLEEQVHELSDIYQILDDCRNKGFCTLNCLKDTQLENLTDFFRERKNELDIFYFSGHGHSEGIQLVGTSTLPHIVSFDKLKNLFSNQQKIKLVFLNACETSSQVEAFQDLGIEYIIAANGSPYEDYARYFAAQFFKSLCLGSNIIKAFNEAKEIVENSSKYGSEEFIWELHHNNPKIVWTPFFKFNNIKGEELSIIHISNLNYNGQVDVLNSLLAKIKASQKNIDLIILSGNQISLEKQNDIKSSYDFIISCLKEHFQIQSRNIIFSTGLNEVNQIEVSSSISDKIHTFTTNDEVNGFIHSIPDFELSARPFNDYNSYIQEKIGQKNSSLYTTQVNSFGNYTLGIVSINSVWSAKKKEQLVFPSNLLKEAFNEVKETDIKILVSHFPLNNFKSFNRYELEDNIFSNFDFMFLGRNNQINRHDNLVSEEGIIAINSPFTNDKQISFSSINFLLKEKKITVNSFIHSTKEDILLLNTPKIYKLPFGENKIEQIRLLATMRRVRERYLEYGNDLFINQEDESTESSFDKYFTEPLIKIKTEDEEIVFKSKTSKSLFKSLYSKENFIVYGKDKSGKSSLLVKIAIDFLEYFIYQKVIPFYINANDYKDKKIDLQKLFARHVDTTFNKSKLFSNKYHIKLLIDNYEPDNIIITKAINKFIEQNDNCSFTLTSDLTTIRGFENFDFGFNSYKKLYIHDVTRIEIRDLVNKSINFNKSEEFRDKVVQQIVSVFKQHKLPFNFWAISLFLWIIIKTRKSEIHVQNNTELIDLFIQELLGRKNLANNNTHYRSLTYPQYIKYLSFLAYKFFKHHENDVYSASYQQLVNYTTEFIDKSRKRVATPKSAIDYLLKKGVLKEKSSGYYTFRLNGVFEYFLAIRLDEDKDFLEEVLKNNELYLLFKNELDLYSGLDRRNAISNIELIKKIYFKTKEQVKKYNPYEEETVSIDDLLSEKINGNNVLSLINNSTPDSSLIKPMGIAERDEFFNNIEQLDNDNLLNREQEISLQEEVKLKKRFDENAKKHEILEDYFFILGRVFRNLEITDEELEDEIFAFYIKSVCNWGFLIIDELKDTLNGNLEASQDEEKLYKRLYSMLTSLVPVLVQHFTYNTIGHRTLDDIIHARIETLKVDAKKHQYELFVLYFLLVDLNIKKNIKLIEEMIKYAQIGSIKASIFIKLLEYIVFKTYYDKRLNEQLLNILRKYQIKLNPKIDKRGLDKSIDDLRKKALISRNTDNKN